MRLNFAVRPNGELQKRAAPQAPLICATSPEVRAPRARSSRRSRLPRAHLAADGLDHRACAGRGASIAGRGPVPCAARRSFDAHRPIHHPRLRRQEPWPFSGQPHHPSGLRVDYRHRVRYRRDHSRCRPRTLSDTHSSRPYVLIEAASQLICCHQNLDQCYVRVAPCGRRPLTRPVCSTRRGMTSPASTSA